MRRCKQCCMPDTRPDTPFIDGVCAACISHAKRKTIDWEAREKDLQRIIETTPPNGSGYDCIVPSSGGKDSTWQVLKLLELGLRPLVVTATTCHLTDIGRHNIDNLARFATTIEISPNKTVRRKLNRLGLEMVGDISWPEHCSIFTTPFRVACELGIPLIFYGECPQEAYGGPVGTDEVRIMTRRWVSEFGGFLGLRPADMIGLYGITEDDMRDYDPPSDQEMKMVGVQAYFMGQFFEWNSHRNAEIATMNGMSYSLPTTANWWEMENLDNYQTGIHDYFGFLKYGYGRGCTQLAVDVRAGRIGRHAAMKFALRKDGIFPSEYLRKSVEEIIYAINISMPIFFEIADHFTNWNLLEKGKHSYHGHALAQLKEFGE